MYDVVTYPPLPFWHGIPGGLQPGKMVEIRGTLPFGSESFQINFTNGMDSGGYSADRILHLSIRPPQKLVVRNSMAAGNWQNEDRGGAFPFVPGKQFVILILVEGASYKIAVSGVHHWEFFHRFPVDQARMLFIDGSVRVEEVRIFDKQPIIPNTPTIPQPETVTMNNPVVPFTTTLPNPLLTGSSVEIRGFVPQHADTFEINLTKSANDGYCAVDRPLHISVRCRQSLAVRNTLRNGNWETEERAGYFPFKYGGYFLMKILVDKQCYRISVDGNHCWEFQHRFPVSSVSRLHVSGTVILDHVKFIPPQRPASSRPSSANSAQNTIGLHVHQPIYNPIIPYDYPISEGLKTGLMIYISGHPTSNAQKFTINLVCSRGIRCRNRRSRPPVADDIALHFDARLFCKTVVRNAQINGTWLEEETVSPYFPFAPGLNFDLLIRVESDKYLIALNGQHFIVYQHRITDLKRINKLQIQNQISISCIRFSMS